MNAKLLRITIAILVLTLATLACGLVADEPTSDAEALAAVTESDPVQPTTAPTAKVEESQPTNTAEPTATAKPTSIPEITLGEEYHSKIGGFVFRQPPGYELEDDNGFVTLQTTDTDPDTGPAIIIFRENLDQSLTVDEFYAEQIENFASPDLQFSEPTNFLVNGCMARSTEITGTYEGVAVNARLTAVWLRPGQGFVFLGLSPARSVGAVFFFGASGGRFDLVFYSTGFGANGSR